MIADIPKVKISGIHYPVYAVDFSWGGADGKSELVVDFVNASGDYILPQRQTETSTKIEIGDFLEFNGFPVKTIETFSEQGNTIQVKYVDTSILLDHIYVGLNGLHGKSKKRTLVSENSIQTTIPTPSVSGTFNNIVLVGNYVDPCESITDDYLDPCNPCQSRSDAESLSTENANKRVNCVQERSVKILDITYNFNELIQALGSAGIKFKNIPVVKDSYYSRQTGTAREVLKYWCDELGLTFFWDQDSVVFVDLKTGITINDTNFYTSCSLNSRSVERSIENNTYSGNIYYFGGEGKIETYDCSSDNIYRMSMIPITLKDIFWSQLSSGAVGLSSYISKYYTYKDSPDNRYTDKDSIQGIQLACLLSKYSPHIRDLVLLYHFYGITTIDSDIEGKRFPLLGIKKIISVQKLDEAGADNGAKRLFFNGLDPKLKEFVNENHGKILKIEYNEAWHTKFTEFEKGLADNFIGRYWIRFFSNGNRYKADAPDGSVQYYVAGSPSVLPFMDLIPESVRGESLFLRNVINNSKSLDVKGTSGNETSSSDAGMLENSFLLLDRQPNWEPAENSESIKKFDDEYGKFSPFYINPFRSEVKGKTEDALNISEVFILAYDQPDSFQVVISDDIQYHPIETDNKNIRSEQAGFNSYYGLRSSVCKKYSLVTKVTNGITGGESSNAIDIYFPVQAHDGFGIDYSGYNIFLTASSTTINNKSILEKKEIILGDCPPKLSIGGSSIRDTVGVDINFKDLTSFVMDIITGSNGICGYSENIINGIIDEFKIKTVRQRKVESVSKRYSIKGLPTRKMYLSDGVSSFNIRYGDDGLSTDIVFNNIPPISRNQEIIDKEVEGNLQRRLNKGKILSSANKITL